MQEIWQCRTGWEMLYMGIRRGLHIVEEARLIYLNFSINSHFLPSELYMQIWYTILKNLPAHKKNLLPH